MSALALICSLLRRGLFGWWGGFCVEAGEKEKESARGTMGRGKREERPLPYNVRFSGQICGSLTMAEAGEDLADFECSFKDLSLEC